MVEHFNKPPSKENLNQKIISEWQTACLVADDENRMEKFDNVIVASLVTKPQDSREKLLAKMSPKAREFLGVAREYVKVRNEREGSFSQSPLGKLRKGIEGQYIDSPTEDDMDAESVSSFKELVAEFLKTMRERMMGADYEDINLMLWDILTEIYFEILYFNFTSEENTEARKEEIKNIQTFNFFTSILEGLKKTIKVPLYPNQKADYIENVIDALDGHPGKLILGLSLVFQKITEDLETRKFAPLPQKPAEVRTAFQNLGRGKHAIH